MRGGKLYTTNPDCRKAAKEADVALKMDKEDRLQLIVELLSSDSEEDEEVGEPMEFKSKICVQ